jgi:hypothetical protein
MQNKNHDHEEHEKYILEGFCRTYAQQFQKSCDLIEVRDSPDGIVKLDGELVGIELAEYREQGPRNTDQGRDRLLMQFLYNEWKKDISLQHFTCTLTYHIDPDGNHQIPSTKNNQAARLFADIKRLILQRAIEKPDSFKTYRFHPKEDVPRFQRHDRGTSRYHLASEEWPDLAKYCSDIGLQFHPGHRGWLQGSSLNAYFFTSLDMKEIEKVVKAKLEKVPYYRSRLKPGQTRWLMIYSEGWNPTSRVYEKEQLESAKEFIRNIASETGPGFDAIWWADEVEQPNGGQIIRMDQ